MKMNSISVLFFISSGQQLTKAAQNINTNLKANYSKDVFLNINHTQATKIDLNLHPRPSEGPNTSSL